jgi:orotate phosphoribosyltransferase
VITTGGQVAMSTAELRNRGGLVASVLRIIDQSQGVHPELDAIGCSVIPLLTAEELA